MTNKTRDTQMIKRASKLWADQKTTAQISEAIGMSESGTKQMIKQERKHFPYRNANFGVWTKAEDDLLLSYCNRGLMRAEIIKQVMAAGLDRSKTAICNRMTAINRKWQANHKPTIAIIGCHHNGCDKQSTMAKPIGKFCEEHARAGFPRDMRVVDAGGYATHKNIITMPKLAGAV